MTNWLGNISPQRIAVHRRLAAENLKCCPLCDALNSLKNTECFVCRWHGDFIHEQEKVEEALSELMDRCPELVDPIVQANPIPLGIVERVRLFFRNIARRRVDYRI